MVTIIFQIKNVIVSVVKRIILKTNIILFWYYPVYKNKIKKMVLCVKPSMFSLNEMINKNYILIRNL